jgi:hypothetical protein
LTLVLKLKRLISNRMIFDARALQMVTRICMESAPQLAKLGLVVIIGAFAIGAGAAAAAVLATPRST